MSSLRGFREELLDVVFLLYTLVVEARKEQVVWRRVSDEYRSGHGHGRQ